MTGQPTTPLTDQQLTADHEREIRTLDLSPLMPDRSAAVISGHLAALLGEIDRLRAELEVATEFRLKPAPPAYTPLTVRQDPAYDGTRWAVLHDPGDLAVRRVWTAEGWEMAWASPHDEIYCWPDAASALAAARQAQAEDDREPDVDGAGRTPESYRDHRVAAPVVAAVSSAAEDGGQP